MHNVNSEDMDNQHSKRYAWQPSHTCQYVGKSKYIFVLILIINNVRLKSKILNKWLNQLWVCIGNTNGLYFYSAFLIFWLLKALYNTSQHSYNHIHSHTNGRWLLHKVLSCSSETHTLTFTHHWQRHWEQFGVQFYASFMELGMRKKLFETR